MSPQHCLFHVLLDFLGSRTFFEDALCLPRPLFCPVLDLPGDCYIFMGLTCTAVKTEFRNYFSSFIRNCRVLAHQEFSAIALLLWVGRRTSSTNHIYLCMPLFIYTSYIRIKYIHMHSCAHSHKLVFNIPAPHLPILSSSLHDLLTNRQWITRTTDIDLCYSTAESGSPACRSSNAMKIDPT